MKCYACEKIPEYSCSCSSPMFLICHDDLKSHMEDKTKKHNLRMLDCPEETSLYLRTREAFMNIITEILSETKAKLLKIREKSKEKIDSINTLTNELDAHFKAKSLSKHSIGNAISYLKNDKNFNLQKLKSYIGLHVIETLFKNKEKNESQVETVVPKVKENEDQIEEENKDKEIKEKLNKEEEKKHEENKNPELSSEDENKEQNKSNALSETVELNLLPNQPYIIRNTSSGEYLYVSNDEKGGDKVLESRSNLLECCIFFVTKTETGYTLKIAALGMNIFLAEKDRIGRDRVVEASRKISPKSFFEVYYREGKGFVLQNRKFCE